MLEGLVADDTRCEWLRDGFDAAADDGSPEADVETCGTSPVEDDDGRCDRPFCWVGFGVLRLVDRLMMSFPWTTRLSFDFFRSLVSISRDTRLA